MFAAKQIVWAKTKGYPWWPAQINKIPSSDHNYFKVCFLGQNNHAILEPKAVRKYLENYNDLKTKKYKGLQNSIDLANIQMQKRKIVPVWDEQKSKNTSKPQQKVKKIKKKGKKKLKIKKYISSKKQQQEKQQIQQSIVLEKKASVVKIQPDQNISKQKQIKSEQQSLCVSQRWQESDIQMNEFEYIRNVDRKKIQSAEEQIFNYITRFNSNNFDQIKQCFNSILNIQKSQFKAEELLQSKITNMISYVYRKVSQKSIAVMKKEELQQINRINNNLKQKVVNFLFDCCYYDRYLKKMEKKPSILNSSKEQNPLPNIKSLNKKPRKYKRKGFFKKKQISAIVK